MSASADNSGSQSNTTRCSHCGLVVPEDLLEEAAELQFCCAGCRSVYRVLRDQGLDDFYRLAEGEDREAARVTGRSYDELDEEAFLERHAKRLDDGSLEAELYLEGVHCAACVWLVEKLPRLQRGVLETRLDLGKQLVIVRWDGGTTKLSSAARRLDSLGYPVHPYRGAERRAIRRKEERRLLLRIAVSGAAAGNVMLIAAALYADVFGEMKSEHLDFFRWASMLLTLPVVLYAGSVFWRGALAALRTRTLHMDLPITIGIGAGFVWGAINTVRGSGEIYFDSVTALIFFLLIGRFFQQRQQRGAADAAELLFALTPTTVHLVDSDDPARVRDVPVEALQPGDLVEVRAEETIPVDGQVRAGESRINAALLSGESRPLRVKVGDTVHAGTLNLGGKLRVTVQAAGELTRVGQLMQQIEEHSRRRAPVVQLADRLAGIFVASTLALAVFTFVLWYSAGAQLALERAIALLIVTCPCALGLATPLAVAVAVGRAARRAILIKGGDALEVLAKRSTVILDKTGTLTAGKITLLRWVGDDSLRPLAAALENESAHPLARALAAAEPLETALDVEEVDELAGRGIRGKVAGRVLCIGSPRFVAEQLGEVPDKLARALEEALVAGETPVLIGSEGAIGALATFGDPLRPRAKETLERLRQVGFSLRIVSGDHPRVVEHVATALGVEDYEGGVPPEEKTERVEALRGAGERVVMVGDGVNDAAALAAADCGIAMHGGAEASLQAADVFLGRADLEALVELIEGARATSRVVRRNIVFSLFYNVVGAALAMVGIITPLWAALLMPASSLTVITSSFHAKTFPR